LLHCSHQVVRGTSELLRGTVYQAARPRSRAAWRERCWTSAQLSSQQHWLPEVCSASENTSFDSGQAAMLIVS